MPAHRSFDSPADAELRAEGPSFDLASETFRCAPVPPAGVINDMIASMGVAPDGTVRFSQVNLIGFVQGILARRLWEWHEDVDRAEGDDLLARSGEWVIVDDRDRFDVLLHDDERPVRVETLAQIVVWLVSEYTGRPTTPPGPSGRGRSNGAATSAVGSSSPVSDGSR